MKLHLAEISRRGVFKALAAYAVASWVLIEVVSIIAPAFLLPDWTVAAATTAVVILAYPVLFLAWRYDMSLSGIVRDERRVSNELDIFTRRLSVVVIAVLLGMTALLWGNYVNTYKTDELRSILAAQQGAPAIGNDGLIRSIAILPFEDFSPPPGRRLLADGIPERILHLLAQHRELLVTARTSSFYFRDKQVTAAEIGNILGVQALLEGSVQIEKDRLRVTSQLVRTADQAHIWSDVYEAPLEDIFEVQDTIATSVRDKILSGVSQTASQTPTADYPDLDAYELVLEAKSLLNENNLESAERAADLLRLAIDISPSYADAHAWLGSALSHQAFIIMSLRETDWSKFRELNTELEEASSRALELDSDNAIAILLEGMMSQGSGGEGYAQAVTRALQVAPNNPDALSWIAMLERQGLDFDRAREHIKRARRIDPQNYTVLRQFMLLNCGLEQLAPLVESQLRNYSTATVTALDLRSISHWCDGNYLDWLTAQARLSRLETEASASVSLVRGLANLGDPRFVAVTGDIHKLVPGAFAEPWGGLEIRDLSPYYPGAAERQFGIFRWQMRGGANPYFFTIFFACLQIERGDFKSAEQLLSRGQKLWEEYHAFKEARRKTAETVPIYAMQAWLAGQRGDPQTRDAIAVELLADMEERGLLQWQYTADLMSDTPLLVLLLNGREQEAVAWLRQAADARWPHFQPLLTSPMYAEFRENPEVAVLLKELDVWRQGILAEFSVSGVPEAADPNLVLARVQEIVAPSDLRLAGIAMNADYDYESAARFLERNLANEPLTSQSLALALRLAAITDDNDAAIQLALNAVEAEPENFQYHNLLGFTYLNSGQPRSALDSWRKALSINSEATWLYRWTGTALLLLDDPVSALSEMQLIESDASRLVGLALAYHALGQRRESEDAIQELETNHADSQLLQLSYIYAFRGDVDKAFEWLQKSSDRFVGAMTFTPANPLYASLRGDPRWDTLLEDIGRHPGAAANVSFDPLVGQ